MVISLNVLVSLSGCTHTDIQIDVLRNGLVNAEHSKIIMDFHGHSWKWKLLNLTTYVFVSIKMIYLISKAIMGLVNYDMRI